MLTIPRYKRDGYIFVSNLQEITASKDHHLTLNREGYLLSEYYTNTTSIERARWVKKRRNLLISDNGNFSRMKTLAKKFEKQGESILTQALDEIDQNGKISSDTRSARKALIKEIATECQQINETLDFSSIIASQLKINPHYLIGLEDFTIPVLMMCGLLHPAFKPKAAEVKKFQQATATLYAKQMAGKFGYQPHLDSACKFLVLHAYDYDSAFLGAKQLTTQPEGIAISYGGPMKSRRWISELNFSNKVISFAEKLPEPYLISTAITLGAAHGLNSDTPIHILGVGSPILIALISQLLKQSRAISIDSTAPFKDANAGKLYGSRSALLKMDMYKVAAHTLIDNQAYRSTTPFFKRFEQAFPSNWQKMRSELGITTNTDVKSVVKTLKKNPDLVEAHIPFFSKMRSGNDLMIKRLRMDRAGHNYWILRNICVSVRHRRQDHQALESWVNYQVKRYRAIGSYKWSLAVEKAFALSRLEVGGN